MSVARPPAGRGWTTARRLLAAALGSLAAACASPHVRPGAMTAVEHEHAAAGHLGRPREDDGKYDPEDRPGSPCLLLGMQGGDACMRKTRGVTALREAEERACRGVTDVDAAEGPLTGGRSAFTAQPLIDYDDQATVYGVALTFATDLTNADRLQSLVECHRARNANRGLAEGHACPLDDPSLDVMVIASPRGVLLELRSEDPAVARSAWERARDAARASRLSPTRPRVPGGS
jgi:hypothetical protein